MRSFTMTVWMLLMAGMLVVAGCTGDDDDFPQGDDDAADDDAADDDAADDDAADDDAADDDTADDDAGDDDSAVMATIEGTISLQGVSPTSDPPYTLGVSAFLEANCGGAGPEGEPVAFTQIEASELPVEYTLESEEGVPVCMAAVLDDNNSGVEMGPDSGDLMGYDPSGVTPPASDVDISLMFAMP